MEFCHQFDAHTFKDALAAANPMANPMMDPSNMVDMMKKNMVMIVPQIFLMTWVNYFFSGFVCG
jgi:hypothetical protein